MASRRGTTVEVPLYAVVLAVNYNPRSSSKSSFAPLSPSVPSPLLPVAGTPLIDYTLEFLASNGVEKVFVAYSGEDHEIGSHLNGSSFVTSKDSMLDVRGVPLEHCSSVCGALREIHSMDVIVNDFILVRELTVSNISLAKTLSEFKICRAKDREHLMTCVFTKGSSASLRHARALNASAKVCLALDSNSGRIVQYGELRGGDRFLVKLEELFGERKKKALRIRADCHDTGIDICSPEILTLITDNFDWRSLRGDAFRGILYSEILDKPIHAAILDSGYAQKVDSLAAYYTANSDVKRRWAHPVAPDSNISGHTNFRQVSAGLYKDSSVELDQLCTVEPVCVLAQKVKVDAKAMVRDSVVGPGSKVCEGAVVSASVLHSNVVVEEGAIVHGAIVGDNVRIGRGACIHSGAVLGAGVKIGPGHHVRANTRLSSAVDEDSEDEVSEYEYSGDESPAENANSSPVLAGRGFRNHVSVVGKGGSGFLLRGRATNLNHPKWCPPTVISQEKALMTRASNGLKSGNTSDSASGTSGYTTPVSSASTLLSHGASATSVMGMLTTPSSSDTKEAFRNSPGLNSSTGDYDNISKLEMSSSFFMASEEDDSEPERDLAFDYDGTKDEDGTDDFNARIREVMEQYETCDDLGSLRTELMGIKLATNRPYAEVAVACYGELADVKIHDKLETLNITGTMSQENRAATYIKALVGLANDICRLIGKMDAQCVHILGERWGEWVMAMGVAEPVVKLTPLYFVELLKALNSADLVETSELGTWANDQEEGELPPFVAGAVKWARKLSGNTDESSEYSYDSSSSESLYEYEESDGEDAPPCKVERSLSVNAIKIGAVPKDGGESSYEYEYE